MWTHSAKTAAALAVAAMLLAPLPALAKPTIQQRADTEESCEKGGGSMKSCCEGVGGSYSANDVKGTNGRVIHVESCLIALSPGGPSRTLTHRTLAPKLMVNTTN
jgi:hypothetical protein